jgi:hypothetical protein
MPVQVHHLTYENIGREKDEDLLAVCERCHRSFHDLPNATPKAWILQRVEYMACTSLDFKYQRILDALGETRAHDAKCLCPSCRERRNKQ